MKYINRKINRNKTNKVMLLLVDQCFYLFHLIRSESVLIIISHGGNEVKINTTKEEKRHKGNADMIVNIVSTMNE